MSSAQNSTDPSDYCTIQTCSLDLANFTYVPTLAGNVTYLAIFAAILIPQIYLGIRYKIFGFLVAMAGGLILEIIGYLICLTIGPAFISAAIYLCLGRIVVVYGESISRVQPRAYSILFICCDFLSLVLQAAGGALSATADTKKDGDTGVNIMIAGLSTQVVSLFLFMVLGAEFAWRVRKNPHQLNEQFAGLRSSWMWKGFLIGLVVATVAIFIRCVFRVAELTEGFNGPIFNDEVAFMILEGPMIIIACLAMTVFHPGIVLRGHLQDTNWTLRGSKPSIDTHHKLESMEMASGVSEVRS